MFLLLTGRGTINDGSSHKATFSAPSSRCPAAPQLASEQTRQRPHQLETSLRRFSGGWFTLLGKQVADASRSVSTSIREVTEALGLLQLQCRPHLRHTDARRMLQSCRPALGAGPQSSHRHNRTRMLKAHLGKENSVISKISTSISSTSS